MNRFSPGIFFAGCERYSCFWFNFFKFVSLKSFLPPLTSFLPPSPFNLSPISKPRKMEVLKKVVCGSDLVRVRTGKKRGGKNF